MDFKCLCIDQSRTHIPFRISQRRTRAEQSGFPLFTIQAPYYYISRSGRSGLGRFRPDLAYQRSPVLVVCAKRVPSIKMHLRHLPLELANSRFWRFPRVDSDARDRQWWNDESAVWTFHSRGPQNAQSCLTLGHALKGMDRARHWTLKFWFLIFWRLTTATSWPLLDADWLSV